MPLFLSARCTTNGRGSCQSLRSVTTKIIRAATYGEGARAPKVAAMHDDHRAGSILIGTKRGCRARRFSRARDNTGRAKRAAAKASCSMHRRLVSRASRHGRFSDAIRRASAHAAASREYCAHFIFSGERALSHRYWLPLIPSLTTTPATTSRVHAHVASAAADEMVFAAVATIS